MSRRLLVLAIASFLLGLTVLLGGVGWARCPKWEPWHSETVIQNGKELTGKAELNLRGPYVLCLERPGFIPGDVSRKDGSLKCEINLSVESASVSFRQTVQQLEPAYSKGGKQTYLIGKPVLLPERGEYHVLVRVKEVPLIAANERVKLKLEYISYKKQQRYLWEALAFAVFCFFSLTGLMLTYVWYTAGSRNARLPGSPPAT